MHSNFAPDAPYGARIFFLEVRAKNAQLRSTAFERQKNDDRNDATGAVDLTEYMEVRDWAPAGGRWHRSHVLFVHHIMTNLRETGEV